MLTVMGVCTKTYFLESYRYSLIMKALIRCRPVYDAGSVHHLVEKALKIAHKPIIILKCLAVDGV